MPKPGFVYFASNPALPSLLKIGMTNLDPQLRLQALDSTSLPRGFILEMSFRVLDARRCEAAIHTILARFRDTADREFFRLDSPTALELCHPSIKPYLFTSGSENPPINIETPKLPETTARVLSFVADHSADDRAYTYHVTGCLGISENDAILVLGDLKEMKFVKSYSEGRGIDYWLPLHKGLRYLKEHPTTWMRVEPDN